MPARIWSSCRPMSAASCAPAQIARRLDADLAIIDKRRERAGVSEVMNIIGDVAGRRAILVDDIVDSAGTLCNAAAALIDSGAEAVYAYVTHGVLSGGAVARVAASPIEKLVLTDSIVATEAVRVSQNMRQLTIAPVDGRGDPADQRGTFGLEPVRLIARPRPGAAAARARPVRPRIKE